MTNEQLIELAQSCAQKKFLFTELFKLLHQKKYNDLETILFACPDEFRQSDWHRLHAKCLLIQNRFADALSVLTSIPEDHKHFIVSDLLICFEKLKLIDEGIAFIDERLAIHFQIPLFLKKIQFFCLAQQDELALTHIEVMLTRFPENQDLKLAHVECLSRLNHASFCFTIRAYNHAHPENVKFWMVQFWHVFRTQDKRIAFNLLMQILYMFPVCLEAQLTLVKAHLSNGATIDARLNLMFYHHMFKTDARAMFLEHELVSEYPELWFEEPAPSIKVPLPSLIATIFSSINVPGVNVSYVVGSANHQMIHGKSLTDIEDIDFVSNIPPLPSTQFFPSPHIPNLYTKYISHEGESYKCEYFVNPLAAVKMLETDVLKRDFTVNGIYCDNEGHIIDPTGLGILDLRHQIIRTIVSSRTSINEDPIRILRAIKLILKGFKPTPELEYAISQWEPHTPLNQGHINAVCHKLITTFTPSTLIIHLKRYHLLEKMFSLSVAGLNDAEILKEFVFRVQSTSPHKRINHGVQINQKDMSL